MGFTLVYKTRSGGTKKLIFLCELHQNILEVVVMYETQIPRVNVMKYV